MAYRLRVYAPTGAGISSIAVYDSSYNILAYRSPAGTSTPCIDLSGISYNVILSALLDDGVTIQSWKVNCDNSVSYQYENECSIAYSSGYSNVQVALSVNAPTYYYLNVSLNLNGGSWSGYSPTYGVDYGIIGPDSDPYVAYALPSAEPVRSGYAFAGWYCSYTGGTYAAGYYNRWYGSTSTSGQSYTFVAQWVQSSYEVTIVYDANGGSGAPPSQKITGTSSSVTATLSSVIPKRSGFSFLGWSSSKTATSPTYSAGQYLSNVYAGSTGYTWTLYAVWGDASGYVWIYYGGRWCKAIPWMYYYGSWKKTIPWVYNGYTWKKTTI